ncbi:MAG: hypothetical protein Q4B60_05400 [Erysipelotrichaceae bacterium]|nr:hypothetical protein [Erysipelotrichaceae bacterium]
MISKKETIKKINNLAEQLKTLEERKELRILEFDEKIENLRKNAEFDKANKITAIDEKFNAQKARIEEDKSAKIALLDEMIGAISSEKTKYDKVLEAIITQENEISKLLGSSN